MRLVMYNCGCNAIVMDLEQVRVCGPKRWWNWYVCVSVFVAWEDGMAGIWTGSELSCETSGTVGLFGSTTPPVHRMVKLTPVIVFVCVSCCVYSSSVLCELQVLPLPTLSRDRPWFVTSKLALLHFLRYTYSASHWQHRYGICCSYLLCLQ
jgi:hypothetical protein